MKKYIVLTFVLLLVLILVVFYVGAASDTLAFAKVGQQIGYFLTGRTSSGAYQTAG